MMDAAWALPDEVQPYRMYSVESSHFVVRYPQNAKEFADRALDYAEYAYGILSQRLDAQAGRITIELVDRVDEMHSFMTTDGQSDYMLIYLWPSQDIFYAYEGKWLERQIAYHIARILIQSTKGVRGVFTAFARGISFRIIICCMRKRHIHFRL